MQRRTPEVTEQAFGEEEAVESPCDQSREKRGDVAGSDRLADEGGPAVVAGRTEEGSKRRDETDKGTLCAVGWGKEKKRKR